MRVHSGALDPVSPAVNEKYSMHGNVALPGAFTQGKVLPLCVALVGKAESETSARAVCVALEFDSPIFKNGKSPLYVSSGVDSAGVDSAGDV